MVSGSRERPLKILLVYDCVFPQSVGGVERRNRELATALAERGHEVTLAGWWREPAPEAPSGAAAVPGVHLLPLGSGETLYDDGGHRRLRAAATFARQCAGLDLARYDLVETAHIPYLHLLPLVRAVRRARRATGRPIPLVISWYEVWGRYWKRYLGHWRWPAYAAFEALAAQLGTVALASSELTRGRLESLRRRRGPVPLLPCGIRLEAIDRAASGVEGAREPAPPLVYAGRLVPEKRLDLLLEALAEPALKGLPEGPLLTVIGDGPDRERLEALAVELSIVHRVRFRGRLATGEDVWAEMARARLAVQPSEREGFGLFPLEAMALGLPVVHCASGESAVAELVRDGVEGRAPEADPQALAEALAGLLADDGERRRLAAAARGRARGYDWRRIAEQAEELFRELIAKGWSRRPPPPAGR